MNTAIPPENRLGLEMMEILWSYHLLQRHSLDADDALDAMRRLKVCQLLTDDILLRLCKFKDGRKDDVSFRRVLDAARERNPKAHPWAEVKKQLARYEQVTRNLKNHRDVYIAHLSKKDRSKLAPPVEMLEAIQLAVKIVDRIAGVRNAYYVCDVDLRAGGF